jgi:hypothetical protein
VTDDLRHAWATLRLPPGSDIEQARSSYRQLARRWHPDRFANDSAGQAEAAIRMRVINAAYRRILEAAGPQSSRVEPNASLRPGGRRLSREEIERLIAAIGTESWVESAIGHPPDGGTTGWYSFHRLDKRWPFTPLGRLSVTAVIGVLVFEALNLWGKPMPPSIAKYVLVGVVALAWVASYALFRLRRPRE